MTRLSNRQFPMLKTFVAAGDRFFMSVDDAAKFDQRPFRSMLIREWVAYRPGKGFHLTRAGRDAVDGIPRHRHLAEESVAPADELFRSEGLRAGPAARRA
jgi:hypothetical protein